MLNDKVLSYIWNNNKYPGQETTSIFSYQFKNNNDISPKRLLPASFINNDTLHFLGLTHYCIMFHFINTHMEGQ